MGYAHDDHASRAIKVRPRLIIHGGAGNLSRKNLPDHLYDQYRSTLLFIVYKTNDYMTSSMTSSGTSEVPYYLNSGKRPSALDVATFAVAQLENHPLFNSGHGAVFTRDGINQLEASVMVSRGHAKRGVGVMGLRRVRNPILLAKKMLEHGDEDLAPNPGSAMQSGLDVPSAQGHAQLYGEAAEQLAQQYRLDMVEPDYFFTQKRWDEHVRALEREKTGKGAASWDADEYLPQGTCGAVALDEDGVVCVATSTGGITNKLTGRIGDTPTLGAGFWAEEWTEKGDPTGKRALTKLTDALWASGPSLSFSGPLQGLLADCLPTLRTYTPIDTSSWLNNTHTTRSIAGSGTGNGDSFLRSCALRTVAALARWKPEAGAMAVTHIVGPGGELQRSAGARWGKTGEGEGGIIGIECAIVRDGDGNVVDTRSQILMDFNCGGMFRAWIDDHGKALMSLWTNGAPDER